jgi:hypothetical protein
MIAYRKATLPENFKDNRSFRLCRIFYVAQWFVEKYAFKKIAYCTQLQESRLNNEVPLQVIVIENYAEVWLARNSTWTI